MKIYGGTVSSHVTRVPATIRALGILEEGMKNGAVFVVHRYDVHNEEVQKSHLSPPFSC